MRLCKKKINICLFNLINLQFTTQHFCSYSVYGFCLKSFFLRSKTKKTVYMFQTTYYNTTFKLV